MRTFDYTHILNNLCYHVSNGSINGIQKEGFLKVSEVNHEVLPRSIVEDKLDRKIAASQGDFFQKKYKKF